MYLSPGIKLPLPERVQPHGAPAGPPRSWGARRPQCGARLRAAAGHRPRRRRGQDDRRYRCPSTTGSIMSTEWSSRPRPGPSRIEDFFVHHREVWARSDLAGFDEVFDLGGLEDFILSSGDRVRALADLASSLDVPGTASRLAIVAPQDFAYGLARMYATYRTHATRAARRPCRCSARCRRRWTGSAPKARARRPAEVPRSRAPATSRRASEPYAHLREPAAGRGRHEHRHETPLRVVVHVAAGGVARVPQVEDPQRELGA